MIEANQKSSVGSQKWIEEWDSTSESTTPTTEKEANHARTPSSTRRIDIFDSSLYDDDDDQSPSTPPASSVGVLGMSSQEGNSSSAAFDLLLPNQPEQQQRVSPLQFHESVTGFALEEFNNAITPLVKGARVSRRRGKSVEARRRTGSGAVGSNGTSNDAGERSPGSRRRNYSNNKNDNSEYLDDPRKRNFRERPNSPGRRVNSGRRSLSRERTNMRSTGRERSSRRIEDGIIQTRSSSRGKAGRRNNNERELTTTPKRASSRERCSRRLEDGIIQTRSSSREKAGRRHFNERESTTTQKRPTSRGRSGRKSSNTNNNEEETTTRRRSPSKEAQSPRRPRSQIFSKPKSPRPRRRAHSSERLHRQRSSTDHRERQRSSEMDAYGNDLTRSPGRRSSNRRERRHNKLSSEAEGERQQNSPRINEHNKDTDGEKMKVETQAGSETDALQGAQLQLEGNSLEIVKADDVSNVKRLEQLPAEISSDNQQAKPKRPTLRGMTRMASISNLASKAISINLIPSKKKEKAGQFGALNKEIDSMVVNETKGKEEEVDNNIAADSNHLQAASGDDNNPHPMNQSSEDTSHLPIASSSRRITQDDENPDFKTSVAGNSKESSEENDVKISTTAHAEHGLANKAENAGDILNAAKTNARRALFERSSSISNFATRALRYATAGKNERKGLLDVDEMSIASENSELKALDQFASTTPVKNENPPLFDAAFPDAEVSTLYKANPKQVRTETANVRDTHGVMTDLTVETSDASDSTDEGSAAVSDRIETNNPADESGVSKDVVGVSTDANYTDDEDGGRNVKCSLQEKSELGRQDSAYLEVESPKVHATSMLTSPHSKESVSKKNSPRKISFARRRAPDPENDRDDLSVEALPEDHAKNTYMSKDVNHPTGGDQSHSKVDQNGPCGDTGPSKRTSKWDTLRHETRRISSESRRRSRAERIEKVGDSSRSEPKPSKPEILGKETTISKFSAVKHGNAFIKNVEKKASESRRHRRRRNNCDDVKKSPRIGRKQVDTPSQKEMKGSSELVANVANLTSGDGTVDDSLNGDRRAPSNWNKLKAGLGKESPAAAVGIVEGERFSSEEGVSSCGETRSTEESGKNAIGDTNGPSAEEAPSLPGISQAEMDSACKDSVEMMTGDELKKAVVEDQKLEERPQGAKESLDNSWDNLRVGLGKMNESQKNFNIEKRILRSNRAGNVKPGQTRRRRARSKDAHRDRRSGIIANEDVVSQEGSTDHEQADPSGQVEQTPNNAECTESDYPQHPHSAEQPQQKSSETEKTTAVGSTPKPGQWPRKTSKWAIVKGGLSFISKMKQEVEKKREEKTDTIGEAPVDIVGAAQKHAEVFKKRSAEHT